MDIQEAIISIGEGNWKSSVRIFTVYGFSFTKEWGLFTITTSLLNPVENKISSAQILIVILLNFA